MRGWFRENPKLVSNEDLDSRVWLHWAVSAGDKEIVSMLLNLWHTATAEQKSEKIKKLTTLILRLMVLLMISDVHQYTWLPALGDLDILELLVNNDTELSINQQIISGQRAICQFSRVCTRVNYFCSSILQVLVQETVFTF